MSRLGYFGNNEEECEPDDDMHETCCCGCAVPVNATGVESTP